MFFAMGCLFTVFCVSVTPQTAKQSNIFWLRHVTAYETKTSATPKCMLTQTSFYWISY